jgi:transcription initiation factor IIE alpha subunit
MTAERGVIPRSFRGFNLFSGSDLALFRAIIDGGANVSGFRNRDLQQRLSMNGRQVSAVLRRLREHGTDWYRKSEVRSSII